MRKPSTPRGDGFSGLEKWARGHLAAHGFPVPPEDKPDTARITGAVFLSGPMHDRIEAERRASDCSIVDHDGNTVTLRVGDYVRTDRVYGSTSLSAAYRPYVALCEIEAAQLVYANQIARPNSGRARYWAARLKFRNRPNRAKRRVVYARFRA